MFLLTEKFNLWRKRVLLENSVVCSWWWHWGLPKNLKLSILHCSNEDLSQTANVIIYHLNWSHFPRHLHRVTNRTAIIYPIKTIRHNFILWWYSKEYNVKYVIIVLECVIEWIMTLYDCCNNKFIRISNSPNEIRWKWQWETHNMYCAAIKTNFC